MQKLDAVVIGAGCIGLALTRELAKRGAQVACLEQASRWGEGITSRNSEVIHAGLYYGDGLPRKRRTSARGRGPPAMDWQVCECGAAFSPFRAHSPPARSKTRRRRARTASANRGGPRPGDSRGDILL